MTYPANITVALSVACFIAFIIVLSRFEFHKRQQLHDYEKIRATLKHLRLFNMLKLLGIDFDEYNQRVPYMEKLRHIYNCQSCKNTGICDNYIPRHKPGRKHANPVKANFCPNYKSLIKHAQNFPEAKFRH